MFRCSWHSLCCSKLVHRFKNTLILSALPYKPCWDFLKGLLFEMIMLLMCCHGLVSHEWEVSEWWLMVGQNICVELWRVSDLTVRPWPTNALCIKAEKMVLYASFSLTHIEALQYLNLSIIPVQVYNCLCAMISFARPLAKDKASLSA